MMQTIMDRALWISWYDLPNNRDAYLAWAHDTYIPGLLRQPGFFWGAHYSSVDKGENKAPTDGVAGRTKDASVPTGNRYILIFAAADCYTFANPTPSALHAQLPESDKEMLGLRMQERVNIMMEATRVDGPAIKNFKEGLLPAPCINLGSFRYPTDGEEEMMGWYAQRRMYAMSLMQGCVRTRKMVSVAGWAKHAIVYEFESQAACKKYFPTREDINPEQQPWSDKVVSRVIHAPGSSNLGIRLWPPIPS
jgi:hypothetical protein